MTFTTLNSEESHPSQLRKQLRLKQRNVHVTNLKRNKKLWQIEKATLQEGKRIKDDLGKLEKAMMIQSLKQTNFQRVEHEINRLQDYDPETVKKMF